MRSQPTNLEKSVNTEITKGWIPLGGVSIAKNYNGVIVFVQSMTNNSAKVEQ